METDQNRKQEKKRGNLHFDACQAESQEPLEMQARKTFYKNKTDETRTSRKEILTVDYPNYDDSPVRLQTQASNIFGNKQAKGTLNVNEETITVTISEVAGPVSIYRK